MKNVRDAGFSRKRGGNGGSGPPLPDPRVKVEKRSPGDPPGVTLPTVSY